MILQKVILEMGSIRGYVVDPLTSTIHLTSKVDKVL